MVGYQSYSMEQQLFVLERDFYVKESTGLQDLMFSNCDLNGSIYTFLTTLVYVYGNNSVLWIKGSNNNNNKRHTHVKYFLGVLHTG